MPKKVPEFYLAGLDSGFHVDDKNRQCPAIVFHFSDKAQQPKVLKLSGKGQETIDSVPFIFSHRMEARAVIKFLREMAQHLETELVQMQLHQDPGNGKSRP